MRGMSTILLRSVFFIMGELVRVIFEDCKDANIYLWKPYNILS